MTIYLIIVICACSVVGIIGYIEINKNILTGQEKETVDTVMMYDYNSTFPWSSIPYPYVKYSPKSVYTVVYCLYASVIIIGSYSVIIWFAGKTYQINKSAVAMTLRTLKLQKQITNILAIQVSYY